MEITFQLNWPPFALELLGDAFVALKMWMKARDPYFKALKINPFLFNVFVKLCNAGAKPDPQKIFSVSFNSLLSL